MSVSALANIKKSIEISTRKEFESAFKKAFNINEKTTVTAGFRSGLLNASVHIFSRSMLRRYFNQFLDNNNTNYSDIDKLFDEYKSNAVSSGMYVTNDTIFTLKASKFIDNKYAQKSLLKFITGKPNTINAINYISKAKISLSDNFEYLKTKVLNKVKSGSKFSDRVNSYIEAGLDLGHIHSNVEYFANIATVSGIAESDIQDIKSIYKNIREVPKELLESYFNAVLDEDRSQLSDIVRQNLFEEIYTSQLRLLRKFSSKDEFSVLLSFNLTKSASLRKITEKEIERIVNKAGIRVGIQNAAINRREGREILAHYRTNLPRFYEAIQRIFIQDISKLDLLNISGSSTGKVLIRQQLINTLSGKPNLPLPQSTVINTKNIPNISKTASKKLPKSGNTSIAKFKQPLRSIQGQFTSVTKLESLIRAQLRPTIVKNMHRPNLEYQSGRFADSVKLESISRARDGALSAFLSYMRYPYATFERDGKQGKKGYYPSRLIEGSVREIASKLVRDRMRVAIQ